jgi:hypothetical protein
LDKYFLFGKLSCEKKKKEMLGMMASVFFLARKLAPNFFCPRMMKNGQHQHKDRPHKKKKSQGAATSAEDAIIILRGLILCGAPL